VEEDDDSVASVVDLAHLTSPPPVPMEEVEGPPCAARTSGPTAP
jgi:hypothetical protein